MKGLKPTLLALCVAGVPPAAMAEIQMLDEAAMGDITGQAGVTIELETQVNIDRLTYTDQGSLEVNDIFVGGTNRTDLFSEMRLNLTGRPANTLLDNIRIDIDVLSDGDAVINFQPQDLAFIDLGIRTGAWNLVGQTDTTTIMDNFRMDALVGSGTLWVDTATDKLNFITDFAIDDMDFDVPFLAIGIRDFELTGSGYDLNAPPCTGSVCQSQHGYLQGAEPCWRG
ncbi:DUF6160 family protein [Marinobacter subterrani]|uniref:DUF6160 domain-containing protein n=1 Tax=Marinobacter subterrani TaxID=1658765 RepID=A0A0J7LZ62_9GAMM|nr:DUF6160 family protein [Marinobacter subterrani]KMQ74165.1 hypothetical protein Msub_10339 [Marinobacter subterrani]